MSWLERGLWLTLALALLTLAIAKPVWRRLDPRVEAGALFAEELSPVDPWGRPWAKHSLFRFAHRRSFTYSLGPNGVDDSRVVFAAYDHLDDMIHGGGYGQTWLLGDDFVVAQGHTLAYLPNAAYQRAQWWSSTLPGLLTLLIGWILAIREGCRRRSPRLAAEVARAIFVAGAPAGTVAGYLLLARPRLDLPTHDLLRVSPWVAVSLTLWGVLALSALGLRTLRASAAPTEGRGERSADASSPDQVQLGRPSGS